MDKVSKLTSGAMIHQVYRAVYSGFGSELPLARLNYLIIHSAFVEILSVIVKTIIQGYPDKDKGPILGLFWIQWALEAVSKEDDAGNLSTL